MTEPTRIAHLWNETPLTVDKLEVGKTYLALAAEVGPDSGIITYYATTQPVSLDDYLTICGFADMNDLLALIIDVTYHDGHTVQFQTQHTSEPFTMTQHLNVDGVSSKNITRMGVN